MDVSVEKNKNSKLSLASADDRERLNSSRSANVGESLASSLFAAAMTAEIVISLQNGEFAFAAETHAGAQVEVTTDLPGVELAAPVVNAHLVLPVQEDQNASVSGTSSDDVLAGSVGDDNLHNIHHTKVLEIVKVHAASLILAPPKSDGVFMDNVYTGMDFSKVLLSDFKGATFIADKGDATLTGTNGNDLFVSVNGNHTFNGGDGSDTVSYAKAEGAVSVILTDATTPGGETGGHSIGSTSSANNDQFVSIENVIGSRFNDTIVGNSGDNVLDGGGGYDVFTGGFGADTFVFKDIFKTLDAATLRAVINDFEHGIDHIDLSNMMRVTIDEVNNTFIFDGQGDTHHDRGHFGYYYGQDGEVGHTYIEGDASTDVTVANEFHIDLIGLITLDHHDFII